MRHTAQLATTLLVAACFTLRADVTVRYSWEVKPNPVLPAELASKMKAQMDERMPEGGIRTQLKGNRAFSTTLGFTSISDFDGAMITIVDPKTRKYATAESSEYLRAVDEVRASMEKRMPEQAKEMMARMSTSTDVRKTGQTKSIHGITATETEVAWTIKMTGGPGPEMRTVFSFWTPAPGEVDRHAALREFAFYSRRAFEGTSPMAAIEKSMTTTPGIGNAMKTLMSELKEAGCVLQMRMAFHAPGLAAMAAKSGVDAETIKKHADDPMMEMAMDLQELSTADVPASVFEIPRSYTALSMSEMLGTVMPALGPGSSRP